MTPPDLETNAERGLSLAELAGVLSEEAPHVEGDASVRVLGLHQDSRKIQGGELFAARVGAEADGVAFVPSAVASGARAILAEHGRELPDLGVPVLRVSNMRRAIAIAAEAIYGSPSRRLPLVGITGTNGKTTTCFLVAHALEALGALPARLGTLGFSLLGRTEDFGLTTPGADELSRLLAHSVEVGATHFVTEVSSHALALNRVAALTFDVAAFTNLTQDHLDFHRTMEGYGAAKARLFTELRPRAAVINLDDPFGAELVKRTSASVTTVSRSMPADISVKSSIIDGAGIRAVLDARGREVTLESRLVGTHNLENLLVALGILVALGYAPERGVEALADARAVPGRLERCDGPSDDLLVVVDYAHTPDALSRVLSALRPLTRGKLRVVFGCGGNRDPGKRPKMGAIAAELADFVWVTNDNPRNEAPEAIAAAITSGIPPQGTPFVMELDRARAIERAVLEADASDTLLIAGKGHEDYQILGAEKRHFDDREHARSALSLRRSRRPA